MSKRSDSLNQDFKRRFQGRTSKIDKDGYIGVIAGKGEPIQRRAGAVPISDAPSKLLGEHQGKIVSQGEKPISMTPVQGGPKLIIEKQWSQKPTRKLSETIASRSISKAGSMIIQSGSATPVKLNSVNTSTENTPLYNRVSYQFESPSQKHQQYQKTPIKVLPQQVDRIPAPAAARQAERYQNQRNHLNSNPPPHHYFKDKIDVTPHRTKLNRKHSYDGAGAKRSHSTKLTKSDKSQLVEIGYREINMSYHALPGGQPPVNFLSPEFLESHDKNLKNLNYVAKQLHNATSKMSGGAQRRTNSYSNPYQNRQNYPSSPGPIRVQDQHNLTSSAFSVKSTISHYRPQQRVSPAVAILQEYQNKGKYYELGGLGPYNIGTENWKAGKARQKAMADFSNNIRKGGSVNSRVGYNYSLQNSYQSSGKYSYKEDYEQSYALGHRNSDFVGGGASPMKHPMGAVPPPPIQKNSTFAEVNGPRLSRALQPRV